MAANTVVRHYSQNAVNALSPLEQLIFKIGERKGLVIIDDDQEARKNGE